MGDSRFHLDDLASWPGSSSNAPYQHVNPEHLNAHNFDLNDTNMGSDVDQDIIVLLGRATPDTKQSILHLLRQSVRANGDSGFPSRQTYTDPAIHPFADTFVPNTSYIEGDGDLSRPIEGDCDMLSLPSVPGYEHYNNNPTQCFESMESMESLPRPISLPVFSNEELLSVRQMAQKPHFTAPNPSTQGLPIPKPKYTLAGATMSSQSRNYICACQMPFGTKGDLERHQKTACSLTKDKIQYTCLLHVGATTCDRPCSTDSHNNDCSPSCQYRPKYNDFRATPYQSRPDKMRLHLIASHGWDTLPQGAIPKSWLWPLKRIPTTTGRTQRVWACSLCDEPLGTWEEDDERITDHCINCVNGTDARAARYKRFHGKELRALLNKHKAVSSLGDGSIMQDDDETEDVVNEEFDNMNELF